MWDKLSVFKIHYVLLNAFLNMKWPFFEITQDLMPDLAVSKFHDILIRLIGARHVRGHFCPKFQ